MRERCVGVQADSARVITPQRPSDRTRPPWTPVRMAADPSAPVTCLRTARAPTSAPLPLLPVPVACLESGSTTLRSGRQRASILGSRAVADKATALGVSESGTLPARACAVGAGGPRQGFLSDGASFRRRLPTVPGRAQGCLRASARPSSAQTRQGAQHSPLQCEIARSGLCMHVPRSRAAESGPAGDGDYMYAAPTARRHCSGARGGIPMGSTGPTS